MRVLIAGDFVPRKDVARVFEEGDYDSVLGEIKPLIEQVDYSIVNLECPVIKGDELPIEKCGPNLSCSEKGIAALKWAGFNCVTLANNHFYDYGEDGVRNTISVCLDYGLDVLGGGINIEEASKTLYREIAGYKLGIINCCEREFSIATGTSAGSNPLNPIHQYYKILEAKKDADFVIIIIHGGHEQYQLPSPRMQELYRFFIDVGADAVINHHQHCFSGYEYYKSKPIFYGLGNFCFYMDSPVPEGWNDGFMLELELNTKVVRGNIIPYCQCKDSRTVHVLPSNTFDDKIDDLNSIISDSQRLAQERDSYYEDSMKSIALTIEPVKNRIVASLQSRGLLPLSWSKKSLVQLENYVMCEAHRDKMEFFFRNYFK